MRQTHIHAKSVSQHWANHPPRHTLRDLNGEIEAGDVAHCPGDDVFGRRSTAAGFASGSSMSFLSQNSGKLPLRTTALAGNPIIDEIKLARSQLSHEFSKEADELKIMIGRLRDSLQSVHEDVSRLREQSDALREPKSRPQKSLRKRPSAPVTSESSLALDHTYSALFTVQSSPALSEDAMMKVVSAPDTDTWLESQFGFQRPSCKGNPDVEETVIMNGVSEISHIPRCGQDDPLDWSSLKGTKGPMGERRRASFTDDTKVVDAHESVDTSKTLSSPFGNQYSKTLSSPLGNNIGKVILEETFQATESSKFTTASTFIARSRPVVLTLPSAMSGPESMPVKSMSSTLRSQESNRYVLYPDSARRNAWDICSFIVLIYDCIIIPYTLAWRPPTESTSLVVGTWATMAFWTIDMILSFNTAYYVGGDVETRRFLIMKHYLKTSFMFDAVATGCDWVIATIQFLPGVSTDRNLASLLRIVKAQRALRVARFLNVSSLWNRLEQMHVMFLTDAWQMVTQMITMLLALLLVNHLICCMWYGIGTQAHKDTGMTWLDAIEQVADAHTTYYDYNLIYQYVTSYHWSVVQMFVGSTQVNAMNSSERIFNIFCNFFGMFFTAGITSWFSALLVSYQQQQNEFQSTMKSVRRYLRMNKVDPSISARVQKQLSLRLSVRKRDTENDIEAFKLLSKVLRAEVRLDVARDLLFAHPMIMLIDRFDHNFALNLALQFEYVESLPNEEVFEAKQPMDKTFGILRGCLVYTYQGAEENENSQFDRSSIDCGDFTGQGTLCLSGDWIAEAAIWVRDWHTRGLMECYKEAELISIDRTRFQIACGRNGKIQILMSAYTKSYADLLQNKRESELSDVTPPVDHPVVVMNMDTRDRMVAAEPVLLQLRSQERGVFSLKSRPKKGADVLEKEVMTGECGLILDRSGNASRIAFIVLLRAERSDGLVLIQVAKFSDGHATAKVQMPATKMKDGERVTDAAQRILKKNLGQFGGAQPMGRHTQDVHIKPTEGYGMDTCFYRTQIRVPFEMSDVAPPIIDYDYRSVHQTSSYTKNLHRSYSRGNKWEGSILADAMPDELYFVGSGPGSGTVYAWMSDTTFKLLGEVEHEKLLEDYVSRLQIPVELRGSHIAQTISHLGRKLPKE